GQFLIVSVDNLGPTLKDVRLNILSPYRASERNGILRIGRDGRPGDGTPSVIDHQLRDGYPKSVRWVETDLELVGYTTTEWKFVHAAIDGDPALIRLGADEFKGWVEWRFNSVVTNRVATFTGNRSIPQPESSKTINRIDGRNLAADLQKIRLIRGEIDTNGAIVTSAIGVSQVYESAFDDYWVAHRNELSAIPEAGDAHRLCVTAWRGLEKYNRAVSRRTFISNEDLEAIVKGAQRASDSLGVAEDSVRRR
ncbi:MAG: hypothetical protein ACREMY_04410, partial [bacterium]